MTIFGAGHQVVTSLTRPASPVVGQIVYETDTFSYRWWTGANLQPSVVTNYIIKI